MTYDWTPELRKGLTFGSSVVDPRGRRIVLGRDTTVNDDWLVAGVRLYEVDPGTLQPPTLRFISELVERKFGASVAGASIVPAGGYIHIVIPGIDLKVYGTAQRDCYRAAVTYILAMMDV